MSTPLTINNKTFNYPTPGESPGWGEDATDWASEVTDVLATVSGLGDIAATSASIANDQSSAANVVGLAFDTTVVRSADITYQVVRTGTVSGSSVTMVESGELVIVYNGSSWEISRRITGEAEVEFTITNAGQVQYTSNDISSGAGVTGYTGTMKFKAVALTQ